MGVARYLLLFTAALCVVNARQLRQSSGTVYLDWRVTTARQAPDCFEKNVILVNDQFQPTIEVKQGDTLVVNVFNDLPSTYPTTSGGLSIHWHGLSQKASPWYDGVSYVTQCPIAPGTNFTYVIPITDPPGTYLWHEHSSMLRGDGLQGALIIKPADGQSEAGLQGSYDEERVMLLQDWFHGQAEQLMMSLNRPFDANKSTNETGAWRWVSLPQSVLINGKGFYGDCNLIGGLGPIAGQATNATTCNVTNYSVPPGRSTVIPWASPSNPGCTHSNITVEVGKTYRVRIINAATLVYMSVCFEGHRVTIIAADGRPTEPLETTCIDVNSGQRYDVLLRASQPAGNYWITAQPQYRIGSPSGYAVLRYTGQNETLPTGNLTQPGTITPWNVSQINAVVASSKLLEGSTFAKVPEGEASQKLIINSTQPLLEYNGFIRWALNNVVHTKNPTCEPFLTSMRSLGGDSYLLRNVANDTELKSLDTFNAVFTQNGPTEGPFPKQALFLDGVTPRLDKPVAAAHVIKISGGQIIDVVVQNLPAGANGGEYRFNTSRTGQEQHPFHLHGYHFWLLGTGTGVFDYANSTFTSQLNYKNPALRDTLTVLANGWAALRFKANNPGVWPFHCHISWHSQIGQMLYFVEDTDKVPQPPAGLPVCQRNCTYQFAPWTPSYVKKRFAGSGYELP